ncbi:hypothetical protein [Phaeocystidibacter marisrubri]|uniref:Uncharacterized protein n=1 Tax=Phaeocystidibacter marisrubri TaxID=1577780 RepID=A0A6L3ZED6_9FLAO|nr:hypothetical protein [Phaeocystidibacter marisrubri]KAB2815015.1 hypothetical protein F8C82_14630 [Phaeocystidibacter marisrubri]
MTKESFIDHLNEKGLAFDMIDDGIQFNNQGYVYLRSLTSLPEGIELTQNAYGGSRLKKLLQ